MGSNGTLSICYIVSLSLLQIRGARDVVAFLFNDFLLIVKPKLFLRKAATPADLEPFGKNEFIIYRNVSCT